MKYISLITTIILAIMLFMGGKVSADTVTYQAPLVYSLDLKGPYMYESEGITTEGTIASITANWEFSGQVRLEVSANNGKNYTPIINGMPLEKGFVAGDNLRFRALLEPESRLSRVTLSYKDNKGIRETFGNPQLSGFPFRKAIDIVNAQDSELFNYQMKIRVGEGASSEKADVYCEGKIKADFKDVRFTAGDGQTNLAYYLESIQGEKPNRIAIFWVKVPHLPKKGESLRIYLYYGKLEAEDLSYAEKVFDFYEDFNAKELEPQKWGIYNELKGEIDLADGKLKLKNSGIYASNFKLQDGIIEFKAKIDGACGIQGIVRDKKQGSVYSPIAQAVYSSGFPGAEHTIAVGDMVKVNIGNPISKGRDYLYQIQAEGLNLTFERYDAQTYEKQAELRFSDVGGLTQGYIGLKGDCAAKDKGAVYGDWLRVRQYTKVLPRIIYIGKEELANLAKFEASGVYESKTIPVDFIVRIMSVESEYPLNISADAGKTYKKNAENKKYYYASLKDFEEDEQLKWQLEQVPNLGQVILHYYPGTITILTPNGGEKFTAGSLQGVLWSAQEYEPAYLFRLEYSLDRGHTYKMVKKEIPNSGVFNWYVPAGISSSEALVRISDSKAQEVYDVSDKLFSIIAQ